MFNGLRVWKNKLECPVLDISSCVTCRIDLLDDPVHLRYGCQYVCNLPRWSHTWMYRGQQKGSFNAYDLVYLNVQNLTNGSEPLSQTERTV